MRTRGFKARDLKSESGEWLDLPDAVNAAIALNNEVAGALTTGAGKTVAQRAPIKPSRTCAHLEQAWRTSPGFCRLRDGTQRDYINKIRPFIDEFGDVPISVIAHHDLYAWWEELHKQRGHAMANGIIAITRAMLSHAMRIGWRKDNPAHNLRLPGLPPRVVVWTPSEVIAYVELADKMGLYSVGDAVVVALHTGQRQGDVLSLRLQKVDRGRAILQQSKTGARIEVPFTQPLADRIDAIKRRRLQGPIIHLASSQQLVLRADGEPYSGYRLNVHFRKVRTELSKTMPSILEKKFLDLRDTSVTRLALARATIPMIAAITGHSLKTIHQILEHYLALDDRMAADGIERLKKWMDEEGIAI